MPVVFSPFISESISVPSETNYWFQIIDSRFVNSNMIFWNHSYWTLTQFQGHRCELSIQGSERGFQRGKFLFLTKPQKALVMVWSDIIDEVTTVDKTRIKNLLVREKKSCLLLHIREIKLKLYIWGPVDSNPSVGPIKITPLYETD